MGRVLVVGSANLDLVVDVPRLPRPGETVGDGSFRTEIGGKGLNQAIAAARVGAATTFIGCVGTDTGGDLLVERLRAEDVDVEHVSRATSATGTAVVLVSPDGENMIAVAPGANGQLEVDTSERLPAADVLVLQLEVPLGVVVACARAARDRGTHVVLNLAPAPGPSAVAALRGVADLVVANREEAAVMVGDAAPSELAARLRARLGADAVVTAGAAGLAFADGAGVRILAAYTIRTLDTVGAGDAFCGVLAACLAEDEDADEALRMASAAGAVTASRRGAATAMPTRSEVIALVAGGRA